MDTSSDSDQTISLHYVRATHPNDVLPIGGQGTVSVCATDVDNTLRIVLSTPDGYSVGLSVDAEAASFWMTTGGPGVILDKSTAPALRLNEPGVNQPYWLSLDTNNRCLRYGKGEMLHHLMLFEFSWAGQKDHPLNRFGKQLKQLRVEGASIDHLRILQVPVTLDPSPMLVPSSAITMESIAANRLSVIEDLPDACRRLYANVAGPGMTLAPADFPEFAQAIQYSIVTPGALCYEQLLEKHQSNPQFG